MKTMYDLTPEERKRCIPERVKYLIQINESRLKVWSLPMSEKEQIQKENAFLRDLLNELENEVK